jgi:ABC-type amino acid transport system permease subunit
MDNDLCRWMSDESAGDKGDMQQRLVEYTTKYSVYDDVLLLDTTGHVRLQRDHSQPVSSSRDRLIVTTLNTHEPYVESWNLSDLRPQGEPALIYSAPIRDPNHPNDPPIGLLCLSFRLQDEMAGIFKQLAHRGIILALMSVPIIVSIGEDALKAVPDSYREAGLALGATRWQLVYRVLLPAAKNGLLAAALLGVARAVGETMAVLMATGHAINIPGSLLDPVRTLTATIAAELGEAPVHSAHYRVLFVIGILLFLITTAVNLTADLVIRGIRRK